MSKEVAQTILKQLGGGRFSTMTGAKDFISLNEKLGGLQFRIPSNISKNRISHVRVVLDGSDTYDVKFIKVRGTKVTTLKELTGVYCDQLVEIFESETGLYTSL